MNEKINITNANGGQIQADLICFIENTASNKKYIYYTLNETVGTGTSSTVKIYVANLKLNNPALDTPISEEEWGVLKGFMGDALKSITNPNVKYIPLTEINGNISTVSERAIAMPTSYDYINKQRGIYATAVASMDTVASAPVEPAPAVTAPPLAPETAPEVVVPTPSVIEPTPEPIVPAPTPVVEPVSVTVPTPEPIAPTPIAASLEPSETTMPPDDETDSSTNSALQLEPIDIKIIESKYADMVATIEKLKNQEIEAAKRYNATIELSQMHNEQHASYVQSEAQKETPIASTNPSIEITTGPTINPVPVAGAPVNITPTPTPAPSSTQTVEPTPVTTTIPEPAPAVSQAELETNWFDLPAA